MKKTFFILIFVLFLIISFSYAATLQCFDDGSIKVTGIAKRWPMKAKEKSGGGDWFEVPGRYYIYKIVKDKKTYVFESDEALFVSQEGAKYSVKFGKYKSTIKCPPFKFSCRIFNMSVDYCYNRNGLFTSKFIVYNFHFDETSVLRFTQPFMLWYEAKTKDNRNLIHAPDRYSAGFKEVNISMRKLNAGSKFIFQWSTEERIKKFIIRYNQCRQERYNFYKSTQCTEAISCTINRDCLEDEYCEQGLCKKLDCEECQYIESHQCLNYSCCFDEECGFGEKCFNHSCMDLNCSFNEEIVNHTCMKLECAPNEKIEEHACVECAEDKYASNYTCLKLECLEDEFIFNHTCQKLDCNLFQKAKNHRCINYFVYFYNNLFKSKK